MQVGKDTVFSRHHLTRKKEQTTFQGKLARLIGNYPKVIVLWGDCLLIRQSEGTAIKRLLPPCQAKNRAYTDTEGTFTATTTYTSVCVYKNW